MSEYRAYHYMMPEPSKVSLLLRSIPKEWEWVQAILLAPKELYEQERIAENTRICIRNGCWSIEGRRERSYEDELEHPTIPRKGIRHSAHHILFKGAFCSSLEVQMSPPTGRLRTTLATLIEHGYKGTVVAISGYDSEIGETKEEFNIFYESALNNMDYVEIRWNSAKDSDGRPHGLRDNVQPLLGLCRSLGLKRLVLDSI